MTVGDCSAIVPRWSVIVRMWDVRTVSGGLIVLEALAQCAFLELARGRARNSVHELERVGQPEFRKLVREECTEFCGRRGCAGLQHDGGERTFRPFRIVDCEHRR